MGGGYINRPKNPKPVNSFKQMKPPQNTIFITSAPYTENRRRRKARGRVLSGQLDRKIEEKPCLLFFPRRLRFVERNDQHIQIVVTHAAQKTAL